MSCKPLGVPSLMLTSRVFADPVMVRKALDAQFTINAQ